MIINILFKNMYTKTLNEFKTQNLKIQDEFKLRLTLFIFLKYLLYMPQ